VSVAFDVVQKAVLPSRHLGGRQRDLYLALSPAPSPHTERNGVLPEIEELLRFDAKLVAEGVLEFSVPPPHTIVPEVEVAELGERRVKLDIGIAERNECLYVACVERFYGTAVELHGLLRHAVSLTRTAQPRPEVTAQRSLSDRAKLDSQGLGKEGILLPMSRANVEVLKRWLDAYNRRDVEEIIALSDPDVEFRSIFVAVEPVFRGYDGIHGYFEGLNDAYDHFQLVPTEFIDAGAAALWSGHAAWRGKESGAEGKTELVAVMWLRAGKAFRIETFLERAEALEAVGLSEEQALAASTATQDNVERYRRFLSALSGRDEDLLVAFCDPSIEIHSVFAAVGGAVYHGHEGARQWHRDLQGSFGGEFRVEPEAFFDMDDYTLAFTVLHGRGGQSGAEVTMPATGVAKWRDGLCVSHKGYLHKEDALRELGVSENALQPIAP
jgi:ketosteroid isomerase-like protein